MGTTMLIVDDEYLERVLIRNIYPWATQCIHDIWEAETPSEALDLFRAHRPQLVMMDIQMPEMDGLTLSARLKEMDPNVEIIIISSHGNFQFAKQALQMGITSYVLKPIHKEELVAAVMQALQRISKKTEENTILKESFLQRLVGGRTSELEFQEKIQTFRCEFFAEQSQVVLVKPKDAKKVKENLEKSKEAMKKAFGCESVVFEHYTEVMVAVVKPPLEDISFLTASDFFTVVSEILYGKEGIEANYYEACKLLAEKMILKENSQKQIHAPSFQAFQKHFRNCLPDVWQEDLKCYLEDVENHSYEIFREDVLGIIFGIADILWENGYEVNDVLPNVYQIIGEAPTKEAVKETAWTFTEQAYTFYTKRCIVRRNQNLEKISHYIEQNLSQEALSLQTIAAQFYLNSSYLSRIFKQYFKKTVVEYITEKRMEKAIELFTTTDWKSYEVAVAVGISDPQYFSKCFKKYTGKSVRAFCQSIG